MGQTKDEIEKPTDEIVEPNVVEQVADTPGQDENGDGLTAGVVGPEAGTQPGDVLGI